MAQEPQGRLEVEWRFLENLMALVRTEGAGRPQASLGVYPQAPKQVRVRPGLLRGSKVKSARKTRSFSRGAGGDGALASEAMLPAAPGRSCS